jgi:hypothetical protein
MEADGARVALGNSISESAPSMPAEFRLFALAQSELIAPVDIFTLMMRSLISILYGGGNNLRRSYSARSR